MAGPVGREIGRLGSPEAYCFVLNLDARGGQDRLEFQLMPPVISESKAANYDNIPVIGRSLPFRGYSNSTPRQLNLSLEFAALRAAGKYSPTWIRDQVRWIEAKTYPEYEDGWAYPPPRLLVVIGKIIGVTVNLTSCNTSWSGPWQIGENDALPFRAQVDCVFEEWGKNDDDYGHPHGHAEAEAGDNQILRQGEGSRYVQIPLAV